MKHGQHEQWHGGKRAKDWIRTAQQNVDMLALEGELPISLLQLPIIRVLYSVNSTLVT